LAVLAALGACATPPPKVVTVAPPQPDLRKQTVRMSVPPEAGTVGEAADWLLVGSGYSLVLYCAGCPKSAPGIAAEPVSPLAFAKPGETMSALRALLLILGEDRRVVLDDRLRLVTFDTMGGGS
jgi:hypothetical protein